MKSRQVNWATENQFSRPLAGIELEARTLQFTQFSVFSTYPHKRTSGKSLYPNLQTEAYSHTTYKIGRKWTDFENWWVHQSSLCYSNFECPIISTVNFLKTHALSSLHMAFITSLQIFVYILFFLTGNFNLKAGIMSFASWYHYLLPRPHTIPYFIIML